MNKERLVMPFACTMGQKMLMLIGKDGEDKSRIGLSCVPCWATA